MMRSKGWQAHKHTLSIKTPDGHIYKILSNQKETKPQSFMVMQGLGELTFTLHPYHIHITTPTRTHTYKHAHYTHIRSHMHDNGRTRASDRRGTGE